jgi:5'-3' exonuclease
LSGDPTDNTPGCYKIGKERASRIISEHAAEFEEIDLDAERSLWRRIEAEYAASTYRAGCAYTESDANGVALETARLVYIQRAPRELWNPPGIEFGIIEGYADDE